MAVVSSSTIPFVPFRGNPKRVDGGEPRQTSLPDKPGSNELPAKESGSSDIRHGKSEGSGRNFLPRVNYGFLAHLMAEDQGFASGRAVLSSDAIHKQAFIAYQSAQDILGSNDATSGHGAVQGVGTNSSVKVDPPALDLIA